MDDATARAVQETLYFPLLGRARAARRYPRCFPDPWALNAAGFAEQEGTVVTAMAGFPDIVYGLRHQVTVAQVRRYLASHPDAAVVNIGCGLDNLAADLAPELAAGECRIHNLDFPEVIDLRRRWFDHNGARPDGTDIACSVTDHRWMDGIDGSRGLILVAAGVFYYLEVEAVRQLVVALAERFPGGELCYDSESPWMMRGSEAQIARHGTAEVTMPFTLRDPYTPRQWSTRITGVEVMFNFVDVLDGDARSLLPWKYRTAFRVLSALKAMYEVRVRF